MNNDIIILDSKHYRVVNNTISLVFSIDYRIFISLNETDKVYIKNMNSKSIASSHYCSRILTVL